MKTNLILKSNNLPLIEDCKPCQAQADKQALGVSWAVGQLNQLCPNFAQLHFSNSQLALIYVLAYTLISTTIAFLIRPPDTPAVLVCTVRACAQQTRSCL